MKNKMTTIKLIDFAYSKEYAYSYFYFLDFLNDEMERGRALFGFSKEIGKFSLDLFFIHIV